MDVKQKIEIIVHKKWSEIEVHVGINLFLIATDGFADPFLQTHRGSSYKEPKAFYRILQLSS